VPTDPSRRRSGLLDFPTWSQPTIIGYVDLVAGPVWGLTLRVLDAVLPRARVGLVGPFRTHGRGYHGICPRVATSGGSAATEAWPSIPVLASTKTDPPREGRGWDLGKASRRPRTGDLRASDRLRADPGTPSIKIRLKPAHPRRPRDRQRALACEIGDQKLPINSRLLVEPAGHRQDGTSLPQHLAQPGCLAAEVITLGEVGRSTRGVRVQPSREREVATRVRAGTPRPPCAWAPRDPRVQARPDRRRPVRLAHRDGATQPYDGAVATGGAGVTRVTYESGSVSVNCSKRRPSPMMSKA
jgi:hypothetical protein